MTFTLKLPTDQVSPSQIQGSPKTGSMYDLPLVLSAMLLATAGLIFVASASISVAPGMGVSPLHFPMRQAIYLALGLILLLVILQIPMYWWYRQGWALLLAAVLVLVLVLVPGIGKTVNGSRRWIDLGLMNVQSSEIAKLCLVLYVSGYLVRRRDEIRTRIWGFFKPLLVFCVIAVLLLMEPDFGALVVTLCAVMGMIFLSGVRIAHYVGLVCIAGACLAFIALSQQYRLERLTSYTDPFEDKYGAGYQLTQALIAFGRGEWSGLGLGNSIQKLSFLPEAHTDFVFAIVAEETGVLGSVALLALFAVFIWRGLLVARRAEQRSMLFNAYAGYGVVLLLAAQILINLGVNTGLLPTKGLTLPFLSYGGSSLLMCCASVGLLCRISSETCHGNAETVIIVEDSVPVGRDAGVRRKAHSRYGSAGVPR